MANNFAVAKPEEDDSKKTRTRSPAYPYVNLETAIQRARAFYEKEGRNTAPLAVAAKHWGYEAKSSACAQTVAALIGFGLLEDEGMGDKRRLRLTQSALKILLDTRTESSEKAALVRQAALAPRIHQQILDKWGAKGISDENLRHALIFEWEPRFNENKVEGFIREYRDTIAFAKLSESDKISSEDGNNDGESGGGQAPKVGDYVQWESQEVEQFKEPLKVTGVSTDGSHAFVEGSSTGLPMRQLRRVAARPITPTALPQPQFARAAVLPTMTMKEDVYSLPEGRIVIQWPSALSADSIQDVKDWLKLVERKIARSEVPQADERQSR